MIRIIVLFLCFLVPAQILAESSEDVPYSEIDAIDMHLHTGTFENMGPAGKRFLLDLLPNFMPDFLKRWSMSLVARVTMSPYGPFVGIKEQCLQAELQHCILFAVYAPETWGVTSNREIMDHLDNPKNFDRQGIPYFYGFASIDLSNWETEDQSHLEELRQALQHPLMVGIKLAFIHINQRLDESRFDSIYQVAADTGKPVYHHIGSSPLRKLSELPEHAHADYIASYAPEGLLRAIEAYPQTKFILGHMGADFNEEGHEFIDQALDIAEQYDNVYLEISAFGRKSHDPDSKIMTRVLTEIKRRGLIDKTLYGSDGPVHPGYVKSYLERTKAAMAHAGYEATEAERILSGTARKLFGIGL